jgi:lipopolysaccharide biosynthesis glycosyltransferase
MLHSVVAHAGRPVHVHYLHGPGFRRRSLVLIRKMLNELGAEVTDHEIPPQRVEDLPAPSMFTSAMWYRIFLPELLPDVDTVLYLDVDTLAMDDVSPLWQLDISDSYVAAVTNVFMPDDRHRPESLGLDGAESYFNSGVLLMNLSAMRRDDCTASIHDYAASHPELEWPDQDALNVVLGGRRLALAPRWNVMNSLGFEWSAEVFAAPELEQARLHPAVRHFEGPGSWKPWHYESDRASREIYLAHRAMTPWPRCRLEGAPNPARRLAQRGRRGLSRWRRALTSST